MAGAGIISQEVDRVRARLHNLPVEICTEGGAIVRTALLEAATIDTGGDLRLRNVWWQSFPLDVSVDISGSPEHSTAHLAPKPLHGGGAIWSWLEHGTRPHAVGIGTRKGGKGRKRYRIFNTDWKTGPTRPTVHMPAKGTWSRGLEQATPKVIEMARAKLRAAGG